MDRSNENPIVTRRFETRLGLRPRPRVLASSITNFIDDDDDDDDDEEITSKKISQRHRKLPRTSSELREFL